MSIVFFFSSRRRHTRWPRDWSSDVCSSDLGRHVTQHCATVPANHGGADARRNVIVTGGNIRSQRPQGVERGFAALSQQIGRASCRERAERAEGGGGGEVEAATGRAETSSRT